MKALILIVALAGPAAAAQDCQPLDRTLAHLATRYDEVPIAQAALEPGAVPLIVTASAAGSWSIVMATPDGRGCLIGAGQGWRAIPPGREG